VVWHGHYLQYLEVARDGLCAAGGLTPRRALAHGYTVPITRFEVKLKRPARLDDVVEVTAIMRTQEIAKITIDYEIRKLPGRELLATGLTEQVVLNPRNELLLTFPAPVRVLIERILAFHRGERELTGEEIPLPAPAIP
jgi:acyl-CoA thioester hydrolase